MVEFSVGFQGNKSLLMLDTQNGRSWSTRRMKAVQALVVLDYCNAHTQVSVECVCGEAAAYGPVCNGASGLPLTEAHAPLPTCSCPH